MIQFLVGLYVLLFVRTFELNALIILFDTYGQICEISIIRFNRFHVMGKFLNDVYEKN